MDEFAQAFREMRANSDIQFEPVELPEVAPPPDWLVKVMEWLSDLFAPVAGAIGASWFILKWVLLALAIGLIAYLVWQMVWPSIGKRKAATDGPDEWVPEQAAALALLEDADKLAAEGRYDEATHLLLQRSVGQIADARPDLVEPSSTAREIAAEPALPDKARTAFGIIAQRVERSLFALRSLSAEDWQAARTAYADFALEQRALSA